MIEVVMEPTLETQSNIASASESVWPLYRFRSILNMCVYIYICENGLTYWNQRVTILWAMMPGTLLPILIIFRLNTNNERYSP